MKDITILIPIHEYSNELEKYLKESLISVAECQKYYKEFGNLIVKIIIPKNEDLVNEDKTFEDFLINILDEVKKTNGLEESSVCKRNNELKSFCIQINEGVTEFVNTDYFSILEYDDLYYKKWFSMAHRYWESNQDVSMFLPLNININDDKNIEDISFTNEMPLATSFSNELNMIDFDCLQDVSNFNITGGIINTKDFINIGMFKPSIKLAFNQELLLRMTDKKLKIMVVPKEGYYHTINRKNSLTDNYTNTMTNNEAIKWFELAKRECVYKNDRKKTISISKEKDEILK